MPTKIDARSLGDLSRRLLLTAKDAPTEFKRATVSVYRISRTEFKRAATSVYNIKQASVESGSYVESRDLTVTVKARKKPITLMSYGGLFGKRRYTGRIKRRGSRFSYAATFRIVGFKVPDLPFYRETSARYPVAVRYGPSIADMAKNEEVSRNFQAKQIDRARQELTRRLFKAMRDNG